MREGWERRSIANVTMNVEKNGPQSESFRYVDISSVDRVLKAIIVARQMPSTEAPGRARQNLRSGDVLVSTVRPNLNAVAWVPPALHDAIGSTGFAVLRARVDVIPEYLFAIVRSTLFVEAMSDRASGSNYPAVTDAIVKSYEFSLPPLAEQRRIVDLIGAVDEVIEAAHEHEVASARTFAQLRETLFIPSAGWKATTIGNELSRIRRPVVVDTAADYAEIGTRSHGRGVFLKEPVTGEALGSKKVFYVAPGDLVFNIVFAWEGSVALLGEESQGRIASHRFPTFRGSQDWSVEYFNHFFTTARGRDLLVEYSPGGAGRNKTLSVTRLLEVATQVPADSDSAFSILETLRAAEACALSSAQHVLSTRDLRSRLLTTLLSGTHEIPASYDRFLEASAA